MASRKRSQEKAHKNQGLNFDSGGITKKQRRREREKELRRSEAFSSIFFSFLAGTSSLFSFSPTAERAQFVTSSSYAAQESGSKCNEEKVGKERLRQLIELRRDLGWILTSKVPWVFLCLRPIMLMGMVCLSAFLVGAIQLRKVFVVQRLNRIFSVVVSGKV